MVSRIIFALTLLMSNVAMSQDENGLTFSQVLLVELTEESVVVPEGKVWKVVSAVSELPGSSPTQSKVSYIFINGNECHFTRYNTYDTYSTQSATSSGFSNNIFPMWLPTGTNLSSGDMVSALSIIEFNTD